MAVGSTRAGARLAGLPWDGARIDRKACEVGRPAYQDRSSGRPSAYPAADCTPSSARSWKPAMDVAPA